MTTETAILVSIHKAFINFAIRAEKITDEILVDTFVDTAPLMDLLSTANSQIIYGRRGTGKTHALRYVADLVRGRGEVPVYIDLRTIGSNTSIYNDLSRPFSYRAGQLIRDVLAEIVNELYPVALATLDKIPNPEQITVRLDDVNSALSSVRISGTLEEERTDGATLNNKFNVSLAATLKESAGLNLGAEAAAAQSRTLRTKTSGTEIIHVDFGSIQGALKGYLSILGVKRLWLLIDEWSEIPIELQPYLADMLRRTCLPITNIVVKIASIEHRSQFNIRREHGEYIGLELGADVTANLNLDDFLVFDSDENRSIQFFKNLIFKHYQKSEYADKRVQNPGQLIQEAFTQQNAFTEFVRAVEGVPRDALNLAATAATKAYGRKISMNDVVGAARDWYQRDKASAIKSDDKLSDILSIIMSEVIGQRRARAFLFPSKNRNEYVEELFDARVLHILKKNISSNDQPGERFDVFKIDYGCYVDLKNTNREPLGLFQADDGYAEVPRDDYRSIRRAILQPEMLTPNK